MNYLKTLLLALSFIPFFGYSITHCGNETARTTHSFGDIVEFSIGTSEQLNQCSNDGNQFIYTDDAALKFDIVNGINNYSSLNGSFPNGEGYQIESDIPLSECVEISDCVLIADSAGYALQYPPTIDEPEPVVEEPTTLDKTYFTFYLSIYVGLMVVIGLQTGNQFQ